MSKQHTTEPWVGVDPNSGSFRDTKWRVKFDGEGSFSSAPITNNKGDTVALVVEAGGGIHQLKANARRIVACVNACKGVDNRDLEDDNVKFTETLNAFYAYKTEMENIMQILAACQPHVENLLVKYALNQIIKNGEALIKKA